MATILNTTQQYNAADVVTHTNLNQIVGGTTFVAGDGGATDNTSLEVDTTSGSLQIKNQGVTFANELQEIQTNKILGRTTALAGVVEEVELNTDDAMASSSATSLATDGSIKAYVDSQTGIKQTVLSEATTEVQTYSKVSLSETTPPLITAGKDTGLLCTMTPISTSNTIRASLKARFRNQSAGTAVVITLFEDDLAVGISSIVQPPTGFGPHTHTWYFNAADTTEHNYTVRFGTSNASYYSTMDTTPSFGGLTKSTLFIEEIAG